MVPGAPMMRVEYDGIVIAPDGLTAEIVNPRVVIDEVLEGEVMDPAGCDMFWGSHGCDLPADGHTTHLCTIGPNVEDRCSEYDDEAGRVRYWTFEVDEASGAHSNGAWSEWVDGWKGFRV